MIRVTKSASFQPGDYHFDKKGSPRKATSQKRKEKKEVCLIKEMRVPRVSNENKKKDFSFLKENMCSCQRVDVRRVVCQLSARQNKK